MFLFPENPYFSTVLGVSRCNEMQPHEFAATNGTCGNYVPDNAEIAAFLGLLEIKKCYLDHHLTTLFEVVVIWWS